MKTINTNEHYPDEWEISFNNIKKLINGEGSLRAAFIGVWFMGTTALNMIILIPLATYAGMSHNSAPFIWFEKHDLLILFPYMLFGYYVVLKNTICTKSYWIPIARVLTTIVMLNIAYEIYNGI